jgi:hypothetical protein
MCSLLYTTVVAVCCVLLPFAAWVFFAITTVMHHTLRSTAAESSVLFTVTALDELRSVCLPPLCHLLHEILFDSAMWYFRHPAVHFRAVGVELMKQRSVAMID